MKKMIFNFCYEVVGVILIVELSLCDSDPCLPSNHADLHTAGWRGSACRYTAPGVCDKRLTPGWYSVKGSDEKSYRRMIEGPVDMFYCGAINPVSLQRKGSHPSISDGIVNRTGCLSGTESYCQENTTLQIKNCGAFYVYNLKNTSSCPTAYCFGIDMECPKPDPCVQENQKTVSVDNDRSTMCKMSNLKLCDSLLQNNWYRMQYKGLDVKMPTECVDQNSCGTTHPIWLHGHEPSVEDKVVDRKACVSVGSGSSCKCFKEYTIQVKNCSGYLVYNLSRTNDCPERYCFSFKSVCGKTVESTTSDRLDYIYGIVAAVVTAVVMTLMGSFLYHKMKRSHSKVNDELKHKEKQKETRADEKGKN